MRHSSCILLPGFMCDGRLFDAQKRAFEADGYKCLDGRLTGAETVQELAASILASAPRVFAAIGLSMGGIVALEMARLAPDRISHLALLNTTHRADRAGKQRTAQLERVRHGELDLVLRDELKPTYMHPANRLAARLDLLARMADDLGEDVFEQQTHALMDRRSYTQGLSHIRCPTLIMTGEQDAICPPDLHREMASAIPDARLHVIPQCGHLSALEQPKVVSDALLALLAREARPATSFNPAS
ncbi:MAG: alpha/beta fold hydrolase [Pseudomonadota bacterium]